jgi:hypothetical protein
MKGEECLNSCPLIFQRDKDDVSSQKTRPHTPPSTDTVLRKSNRLELGTKRSYKGMQSRHSGEGRPHKKFKYTIQEVNGSRDTIDESPDSDAACWDRSEGNMTLSSFPLLALTGVKLLPVTVSNVFSTREEMCVAIVVKVSESDVNVFRIALNTCDPRFILRLSMKIE